MRNDEYRNTCYCGERIHRLGEGWVHTVSGSVRCYPTTRAIRSAAPRAEPKREDDR